jgi:DNA-binding transcriptional MerR regulator
MSDRPEMSDRAASASAATRRTGKSETAFRTIGEVAEDLDVPAHVLRFWESKFSQLKPLKRGGGRRYYRPEDIQLLRHIRQCLYQEGYTIRGVQKLLGGEAHADSAVDLSDAAAAPSLFPLEPERGRAAPSASAKVPRRAPAPAKKPDLKAALEDIRRELLEARGLLAALTHRRQESEQSEEP